MLELTKEESEILEKRAIDRMCENISEDKKTLPLFEQMVRLAVLATISTIKEYERMKEPL